MIAGYAVLGAIWAALGALAARAAIGATRRNRSAAPPAPRRGWDWPEDEWPSAGGWADREKL